MNNFIKFLAGLAIGAVVGAIGGYIYADKKLANKFDEEIEEYKEYLEYAYEHPKKEEDIPESVIESTKKMQEAIRKAEAKKDYHNIVKKEGYNEMDDLTKRPHQITAIDWYDHDAPEGYTRVELEYDYDTGIAFANGDLEQDYSEECGRDNLNILDETCCYDLYVQNDETKTQFHIVPMDPRE